MRGEREETIHRIRYCENLDHMLFMDLMCTYRTLQSALSHIPLPLDDRLLPSMSVFNLVVQKALSL